jgi:hypothetical protein
MKSSIFWDITPSSPLKTKRRFGGKCPRLFQVFLIAISFTMFSWLSCFSTMKMEATCFSETSVDFQRSTRGYIPEDRTRHKYRCKNLKS